MKNILLRLVVVLFCIVGNARAADNLAATPKDGDDWTGDQVQIRGNLYGLKKLCGDQIQKDACGNKCNNECDNKKYFAPAYVRLDVSKENKDGTILVTPRDNFTPTGTSVSVSPWQANGLLGWLSIGLWGSIETPKPDKPDNLEFVAPRETYTISKSEIENVPYVKYGWTYGLLLVPFKYHPNYKALNFSNSLQVYLGYKQEGNGLAVGPFVSAGVATADIPTAAGQSSTKSGISYGAGWIFDVKKNSGFQLTIMAGQDVFGATAGYPYEGDTWYSVSLGYNLDAQTTK